MIPKGVTVRKMGEPERQPNPFNLLLKASNRDDLSAAKAIISNALGISGSGPLAQIYLSGPERWARLSAPSRLAEIANWLHAECYEAMDLVEIPAISTMGD